MQHQAINVKIKPLSEEEVDLLEEMEDSQPTEKHRQRLAMQQSKDAVYLVAWLNGKPVGHLLLCWGGSPHEPMASQFCGCPNIEDLWVSPDLRSYGIGSQLLSAAEELTREQGFRWIGLGVAIGNVRARDLYRRRGYHETPAGRFEHDTSYVDEAGQERQGTETDVYLVKKL